jgi:hypothetical protein
MKLAAPAEVTLAGFGIGPKGEQAGKLRVGWSRISDQATVNLMFVDTTQTTRDLGVDIIFKMKAYGTDSPGSWACGGDSGAPLFAGRVFGYSGEPHMVTSIVSRSVFSEPGRCEKSAVTDQDSTTVVSLMLPAVSQWLCETTKRSLDICK